MEWQYSPYVIPYAVAGTINLLYALFAWKRRSSTAETVMFLLMLSGCIWAWGNAVEIGYFDINRKLFWTRVTLIGAFTIPTLWLVLTLQYTGKEKWLTRRNLILLFLVPLILLTIVWTNGHNNDHGLYWKYLEVDTSGSFSAWGDVIKGPFYWVSVGYGTLLALVGCFVLIRSANRSPRLISSQVSTMLIASIIPLMGYIIFSTITYPAPRYDITSILFTLSGLTLSWLLFRFRLIDFLPIVQRTLIEKGGYGAIVLDTQDRIVYINPVAKRIIGRSEIEVIGNKFDQILQNNINKFERYKNKKSIQTEIAVGQEKSQRTVELRIIPLYEIGRFIGRLIILQDVTERVQVDENIQQQMQVQVALRNAGAVISSTLKMENVLNRVAEEIGKAVDATSAYVNSYVPNDKMSTVIAEYIGPGANTKESTSDLGTLYPEDGDTEFLKTLQSGQPVVSQIEDSDLTEYEQKEMPAFGIKSILYVPLRIKDQLIGYAEIWDTQRRRDFTPEEITLCQVLVERAAVAFENARSFERTQQTANELKMLFDTSQTLSSKLLEVEDIAKIIARFFVEVMPTFSSALYYPECVISLYDSAENTLRIMSNFYLDDDLERIIEAPIGDEFSCDGYPVTERALETIQPFVVQASDPDADPAELAFMEEHELSTVVVLPMAVKGKAIGMIELESYDNELTLTQDEISLAMTVANQAAVAIENALVFERVQQAANEMKMVFDISQAFSSAALEVREIALVVAHKYVEIIDVHECTISLLNRQENNLKVEATVYWDDDVEPEVISEWPPGKIYPLEGYPGVRSLETMKPIVTPINDHNIDPIEAAYLKENNYTTVVSLPLIVKGQAIGLVELKYFNEVRTFTRDEINLAMTVANQAAVSIENAQNFERLQAERDYSSNVIHSAPSLICGVDGNGIPTLINPVLEQVTGYRKDELIGKNLWKLFYPEAEYEQVRELFRDYSEGELDDYEMRLTCKDGSKRDILWNSITKRDDSGNIIEIIGFGNDITERNQARMELQKVNKQLRKQISEINKLDTALREQAIRDPLTGLFNRRYIDEILEKEVARAARNEEPLSIAILDLDHLKTINDTYGHVTGGDKSLQTLADTVKRMCRKGDTVCRFAGDEFLILLSNTHAQVAYERVLQWKEKISRTIIVSNEDKFGITFSAGVAEFPAHGSTGAEILIHADRALLQAKELGRDQAMIFQHRSSI